MAQEKYKLMVPSGRTLHRLALTQFYLWLTQASNRNYQWPLLEKAIPIAQAAVDKFENTDVPSIQAYAQILLYRLKLKQYDFRMFSNSFRGIEQLVKALENDPSALTLLKQQVNEEIYP